jgi:transposase
VFKPPNLGGRQPARVTTANKRLLRLDGVNGTAIEIFGATTVAVTVALPRRRLICPHCGYRARSRYDTRPRPSRWRHPDMEVWRVELPAHLRQLVWPSHDVVVEAAPFDWPSLPHLTSARHIDGY